MQHGRDGRTGERNLGLDVVRACAIVLVMASHAADVFAAFWGARPPAWLSLAGVFGVELFFVLSGFLIGTLLLRIAARSQAGTGRPGPRDRIVLKDRVAFEDRGKSRDQGLLGDRGMLGDWGVFMVRRWLRTLPLYYLWMAVMACVWKPVDGWWRHMALYATLTQNLLWPMPADNWFGVSWSLAVEEWFYLLFSLPMLLLARLDGGRRTAWWVTGGFIAAGLIARAAVPAGADFGQVVYKVVLFRADAVAYGVAAALLARPRAGAPHREGLGGRDAEGPGTGRQDTARAETVGRGTEQWSAAGHASRALRHPGAALGLGVAIVLFVWAAVAGNVPGLPPVFYRSLFLTVLAAGFALCLPAALRLNPGRGRPARAAATVARWLSRHAYGLYIVHLTVLEVASWTVFVDGWPRPVAIALAVGGSFGLAALAWRWVERPMLALRPEQPTGRPVLPLPGRAPVELV